MEGRVDSMASTTGSKEKSRGALRKLRPTCLLPRALEAKGFSREQIARIENLLADTLECVTHPSFRTKAADELHSGPIPITRDALLHAVAGDGKRRSQARALVRALTREEEEKFFLRFNYARWRMMRILYKFRGQRLTIAALRSLMHWEAIASESREAIVESNLGLVPTMIERSRITGVDFNDLISDGHLALLRAVSKFDCSRGFKFSTYACRAILSAISRSVALSARHRNFFPAEYDPEMQKSDELDRRRVSEESDCAGELSAILGDNLADLSRAEKRVLFERFGVGFDGKRARATAPKTLREVATLFGLTKERVRQIQNKALAKLRRTMESRLFGAA